MTQLLIATTNPGKLVEFQALLEGLTLTLRLPFQIGLHLEVEETGQTYAQNAALKGQAFALASGLLTLADDSGLEVDALEGQPGIHSARFLSTPDATDADRRAYLLQCLEGHRRPWTARFRCVVALAQPGGEVQFAEGICPGEILPEERGTNGFGYDPLFFIPEMGLTMAELDMTEKNRISHRARAVQAMRPILLAHLQKL